MDHYLVRAKLKPRSVAELRQRIAKHDFVNMRPFSEPLTRALYGLRHDSTTDEVLCVQEDCCSPPLAPLRAACRDKYFEPIKWKNFQTGKAGHVSRGCPSRRPL